MKNSKFVFDKLSKLLEQGLVSSRDLKNEIVNILKSKRDEIVFKMKLTSKDEFDILAKRVENLDKELEKNVKVTSGGVGMTSSEKTYTKAEIEALNSGASLDASGNVTPINKNENKATQISEVPEDKPEIITLPMGGATGGGQGVSAPAQKTSNALPTINFDTNNPHTLYATSVTGAGN